MAKVSAEHSLLLSSAMIISFSREREREREMIKHGLYRARVNGARNTALFRFLLARVG